MLLGIVVLLIVLYVAKKITRIVRRHLEHESPEPSAPPSEHPEEADEHDASPTLTHVSPSSCSTSRSVISSTPRRNQQNMSESSPDPEIQFNLEIQGRGGQRHLNDVPEVASEGVSKGDVEVASGGDVEVASGGEGETSFQSIDETLDTTTRSTKEFITPVKGTSRLAKFRRFLSFEGPAENASTQ